ncbi:MAG: ThuA domain-containing protein [Planctomycetia bacterium]|nr:ThuA domain-containing protein [Planctomycetia bacterium]
MKRRDFLTHTLAAAALSTFPARTLLSAEGKKRKLLYYERSSGFIHPSTVLREDGLSVTGRVLKKLGETLGYEVVCTKDGRIFDGSLEEYDAFLLYCCGQLTAAGGEKNSWPLSAAGEKNFYQAIRSGKGVLGFHSASDTNKSGGPGFENRPESERTEYIRMLGGEFIVHGSQQKTTLTFPEPIQLPSLKKLGTSFQTPVEEWYALKNFNPDMHVLIVQETEGMAIEGGNACYNRPAFPCTWARMEGKGRVAYTSLAHNCRVWEEAWLQEIVLDLMKFVTGKLDLDLTPNISTAAPGAYELKRN